MCYIYLPVEDCGPAKLGLIFTKKRWLFVCVLRKTEFCTKAVGRSFIFDCTSINCHFFSNCPKIVNKRQAITGLALTLNLPSHNTIPTLNTLCLHLLRDNKLQFIVQRGKLMYL